MENTKNVEKILESLSGLKIVGSRPLGLMERFMPKSEAVLVSKAKDFSADDQKRLIERKLKTVDTAIYVAAEITGASGIFEMINGQDKEVGICSLDKGKIPAGENYSIDRLLVQTASYNQNFSVKNVAYNNLWQDYHFAALQCADLSIWADTRQVALLPFAAFIRKDQSKHGTFKLDKPIFLKAEEQLEIKIEFPKSVSMPTSNHYLVKILLRGIKTTKRN